MAINAGSGISVSVNEIIEILEKISGRKLKVQRRPATEYWDKYNEIFERKITIDRGVIEREVNKHTQASIDKAHSVFGWHAKVELRDGLLACFKHAERIISVL
jgi:nucleoside-diphosphate-sugar epimerase